MKKIELLPQEEIAGEFTPNPLSFVPMVLPCIYLFAIGVFLVLYQQQIVSIANTLSIFGSFIQPYLNIVFLFLFLIIPAIVIGIFRISLKTPLIFIMIFMLGLFMDASGLSSTYKLYMIIAISILGIFLTNVYRKGHKYYVTNYRLVLERTFLRYDKRDLLLEKIEDVAVEQGVLGRIFNFGNIIPTSAAGIGTGETRSNVHSGIGARIPKSPIDVGVIVGGGKGITGFRARSNNCLFGVSNPLRISDLISSLKYKRSEATKLEDIKTILKSQDDHNKGDTLS